MQNETYNNIGIGITSIGFVMNIMKSLSLDKVFLIIPFFTHQELLAYLSRSNNDIRSIEQVISHKINCFSNFSKRYFDNLVLTINSIQYLFDMEYVVVKDGNLILIKHLDFDKKMGNRAEKIYKAANNVAKLLEENSSNLYLNLKVEI
ncbi:MAG: hypothetical protein GX677_03620 [Treponema sp.]|nr:hypothetical protein [Treponema sp.]